MLRAGLQQCLITPKFLDCIEGKRFLSYLFCLHVGFVEQLHLTIRNAIPFVDAARRADFGEIYFRAWRSATNDYLAKIEKDCIQDLMHRAVHAGGKLAVALRQVGKPVTGTVASHRFV